MIDVRTRAGRDIGGRILRKVAVSFAVGGAAYAITDLTGQPEIWSLALPVFIGSITLVVQVLIEFEARLARVEEANERHSARVEQAVDAGYARVNSATELFGLVEASPLRTDAVVELIRRAALIETRVPPVASRLAQAEIFRVSELLKGLGGAETVAYEGEAADWLLALARLAESSIDAVSLSAVDGQGSTNGGFWWSDLRQRYLEEQHAAVSRGVTIRRVFVVAHPVDPATEADLAGVCRRQADCGVQVRVLDSVSIPSTLRDTMFDFVLFDGACSYEVTPAVRLTESELPTILNTRLELRADRVRTRIERFRQLWDLAQELP